MEDTVPSFVPLSETKAVLLLFIFNQATVDDYSIRICMNVLRPIGEWIIYWNLVCLVENSHSQINPVMGKELEVWCHSHVEFQKRLNVKLLRSV